MSIEVTKFPKSESFEIQAVSNASGFAVFEINAVYESINIRQNNLFFIVGNSDYNGSHTVSSYTQTSPTELLITTETAYSTANTDGQLLSQSTSDANSNWSASRQTPVKLELQRKDLNIVSTSEDAHKDLVITFDEDVNSIIEVGDTIYVNSEGIYDVFLTINKISYGLDNKRIKCSGGYVADTTSGFVNSNDYHENYYVSLSVTVDSEQSTLDLYPNIKGVVNKDLQDIIYSFLFQENEFDYDTVSAKDPNLAKYFTFSITENWLLSSESETDFTEKFFFCYARRSIGQIGDVFEYVVRQAGTLPLAKWLTIGENNAYLTEDGYFMFPFAADILCEVSTVNKNELSLNINKVTQSDDSYPLNDSQNSQNRIRLEKQYSSDISYVDLALFISKITVKHFWDSIPLTGELLDSFSNQDGKLTDGSCLESAPGATLNPVIITIPDFISIDSTSIANDGTGVMALKTSNSLEASTQGTFWNLTFDDTDGNSYFFPCIEYYSDERTLALIHGWRISPALEKTIIYASAQYLVYNTQSVWFWHIKGMTKISDGGSETIHIPYDAENERLHSLGIDDENYFQIDLLPIS